jgi:hypothetical protein
MLATMTFRPNFYLAFPSTGELLRGVANWWSLALVLGSVSVLLWFVYSICLRRLLRVRRIANIRLKRILEEREQ